MNFSEPLLLHEDRVHAEWVDEFDHMNLAFYVAVCDWGSYKFWELANDGRKLEERDSMEYAIVETHVNYIREVRLDDELIVESQLLGFDEKRFHLFHTLRHAQQDFVSATNEVMGLGFNLNARGIQPFTNQVQKKLAKIYEGQKTLPRPANAGRSIALPAKKPI